jgi:hypothetical protein
MAIFKDPDRPKDEEIRYNISEFNDFLLSI